MVKQYYDDFEIGDTTASETGRTVSESEVYAVAGLEGNYSPLHTNQEYMKETEFGARIAQNSLLITLSNGLSNQTPWNPNTIAAYGRDHIRFIAPVFIGDTLRLEREVVNKEQRSEDSGIVTFKEDLYNQHDEIVFTGEYLLLVERKSS